MQFMTTSPAAPTSAPKKRETLAERYTKLSETVEAVENDRQRLSEALSHAVMMLRQEDAGWALPGENGYSGLTLKDMQKWSEDIRASMSGTRDKAPNPHMRNGLMLRHGFIWSGGIHYDGIPGNDGQGTRGKTNVQDIIDALDNQRLFFGHSARRRRESALYSDGLYLVVGQEEGRKRKLRPVPLSEITETHSDPLYEHEIIAYRWTRNEADPITGVREAKSQWVYVDWYDGKIPDNILFEGVKEPVMKTAKAFDLHANRPEGSAFGSPDAIAALVWARIIRDLIMNGVKMQDALAMFAFKVTAPSKNGQQAAAMELAKPTNGGSAAVAGGETDMTPLNTAGKGYDFGSIGFVVSTMAASLHVSGIALAANTALAGSSYGAAKTLDLPGQMAMETRRAEHIEFDKRVLRWLGAKDAAIYFDNFTDETEEYRAVQSAMLAWTTGTLSPEGFRQELEIIYGRKLSGSIPSGAINPNTQTKADKAAAKAAADAAAAAPTSTPSPQQGKSTGAGSADHTSDPQNS